MMTMMANDGDDQLVDFSLFFSYDKYYILRWIYDFYNNVGESINEHLIIEIINTNISLKNKDHRRSFFFYHHH